MDNDCYGGRRSYFRGGKRVALAITYSPSLFVLFEREIRQELASIPLSLQPPSCASILLRVEPRVGTEIILNLQARYTRNIQRRFRMLFNDW